MSIYILFEKYKENKPLIDAYIKRQSVENYNGDGIDPTTTDGSILGLSIGFFLLLLLVSIGIWIWAIVVLIKYWNQLPDWAKVLGVLGVIPAVPLGPVVTLICVYVAKTK
jgi:hypothetical protein